MDINCYSLKAHKSAIRSEISSGYAIFVLVAIYILSNFTLLGHIIIEYCQFYVLFMFTSKLSTTLYQDLSIGLLLIPPPSILNSYSDPLSFVFQCLCIPLLLIYSLGAVGFMLKRCVKDRKSIIFNAVVEMFTYNAFVNICNIFLLNLLFNTCQFLIMRQQLALSQTAKMIAYILVYFSLITIVAVTYLQLYILNPKHRQEEASWHRYL